MIVYTDLNGFIVDIGTSERSDVTRHEVDEEMFKDKCDEFIKGYKIEIQYKKKTVNGEEVYDLDENGKKIEIGRSIYPYIDYNQLCLIQQKYDMEKLTLLIADMIGGADR